MLWCDKFGENQTPLQRNGMAAIPKTGPVKIEKQKRKFIFYCYVYF